MSNDDKLDFIKYMRYVYTTSVIQSVIEHPYHVITVKKQTMHTKLNYHNYIDFIHNKKIFCGLYVSTFGYATSQTINLGTMEYLKNKKIFSNENNNLFFAGTVSDFVSRFFNYPCDSISTKQIVYKKKFYFWEIAKKIYSKNKMQSFYNGFGLYLANGCLWSGVWWVLYEKSKYYSKIYLGQYYYDNKIFIDSVCSVNSTILSTILFNPGILIITKMQANRNATYSEIINNIYMYNGLRGFWKSTMLNIGYYSYSDLTVALTYELCKSYATKNNIIYN
jgi:hypothetical protein